VDTPIAVGSIYIYKLGYLAVFQAQPARLSRSSAVTEPRRGWRAGRGSGLRTCYGPSRHPLSENPNRSLQVDVPVASQA
jgi:hypothetical protein